MRRCLTRQMLGVLLLVFTLSLAAGCGAPPGLPAAGPTAHSSAPSPSAPPATTSPEPTPSWPVTLPVPTVAGGLHQTRALPPARSAVFHAEMTDLWAAVIAGRPDLGMPAFFPLVAYEQVKAIADPAADWRNRLVADFRLDVRAAHRLLGRDARRATLLRVIVPESQAAWINPGVCYNGVGYWHVAGARVVYDVGGQERSFGIASLISWRGRWYVVHFGAVLRSTAGGVVDQPAVGPGVPGPAGGC